MHNKGAMGIGGTDPCGCKSEASCVMGVFPAHLDRSSSVMGVEGARAHQHPGCAHDDDEEEGRKMRKIGNVRGRARGTEYLK